MKVLIVEDSFPVYERLVALLLDIPGLEIIGHAQHAPEAICAIRRLQPEAIILDIRMPGGSGLDILTHVKHTMPSLRVIILTNYHYPQYRQKCMDAGADFFFDKSMEFQKISEVFRQWSPDSSDYQPQPGE